MISGKMDPPSSLLEPGSQSRGGGSRFPRGSPDKPLPEPRERQDLDRPALGEEGSGPAQELVVAAAGYQALLESCLQFGQAGQEVVSDKMDSPSLQLMPLKGVSQEELPGPWSVPSQEPHHLPPQIFKEESDDEQESVSSTPMVAFQVSCVVTPSSL
ncbi:hypothetical protein KIL84_007774 [Mauremys mutica]|uniref:Uncharacterized protein n=1 Tax=Mauremys mutica TaxID=74926 RepID=A0A9D4AXA1_9SAUR|nr:hypothetical protein KIL84_007774 [Mauremys mutica]